MTQRSIVTTTHFSRPLRDALDGLRAAVITARELRTAEQSWRYPSKPGSGSMVLDLLRDSVRAAADALDAGPLAGDEDDFARGIQANLDIVVTALNDAVGKVVRLEPRAESDLALVDQLRRQAQDALSGLKSEIEAARQDLEVLNNQIAEARVHFDEEAAAAANRMTAAEVGATQQVARLDTAISAQQDAFANRLTKWQEELEASRQDQEVTAGKHVENLADLERQARGLVEATSNWTVGERYAGYAKRQEKSAFGWGAGAVLVAVVGVAYLVYTLKDISGVSPAEAIFKSTAGLGIILAAGYMARVSSGHFRQARDARRVELDLDALEPFITRVDDETREHLRTLVALRIFGRPSADSKGEDNPFGHLLDGASEKVLAALRLDGK